MKDDPDVKASKRCTNEPELEISSSSWRKEAAQTNRNINISNTFCTDVSGDNTVLRVDRY